jgi:hypothetical protein
VTLKEGLVRWVAIAHEGQLGRQNSGARASCSHFSEIDLNSTQL